MILTNDQISSQLTKKKRQQYIRRRTKWGGIFEKITKLSIVDFEREFYKKNK